MERSIQRNGLILFLALLVAGVAGFAVARYSNLLAGQVTVAFIGLGALVSVVSWFQMRLEDRERLEKLEMEELAKAHGGSAMFETKDAEAFPAQRSREQFERVFVPIFTVILCLAQGAAAYLLWRWLSRPTTRITLKEPTMALGLFAVFFLVQFLLGKFSSTMARIEAHRLLRPPAGYVLLSAYLCLAVAAGVIGVQAGLLKADFYLAHALCVVLALVSIETLVNLVLEVYRPRVRGKVERPLYESRLVGLLGQPEGLITTAAQALDYQFGFKVSETWFYRFFAKAVGWLVLLQLGVLLLSTCVVFINSGEQGLLERFGRPVQGRTILEPGGHLKWPWPVDKVYRYQTERIQSFNVGFTPDPDHEKEKMVLWTVAHTKEENFLVASHDRRPAEGEEAIAGKRIPPVSLLTVSIPVHYQITDLKAWAYNNEDAPALLHDLATREVVRYLAGADMNDIMSRGRFEAAREMLSRIQAAADARLLGANVISIGLQDLHPPVKVAPDYEKVIGALQTREAKILAARADSIRTNALAAAQAATITNRAAADRAARERGAVAQEGLFTNQIPAFLAAPSVFLERAYLKTFVGATANARKYVLLTTNTHNVLTFDLQESLVRDLSRINVPAPKK